jgi:hypothetical protein
MGQRIEHMKHRLKTDFSILVYSLHIKSLREAGVPPSATLGNLRRTHPAGHLEFILKSNKHTSRAIGRLQITISLFLKFCFILDG